MPKLSTYSSLTSPPTDTSTIPITYSGSTRNVEVGDIIRSHRVVVGPAGSYSDYTCDGTADEVEIQQALDYVNGLGGGTVFVRAGSYTLTARLNLYSNIKFEGERNKAVLTLAAASNTNMVLAKPTLGVENLEICGFSFDGNAANQTTAGTFAGLIHISGNDVLLKNIDVHHNLVKNSYRHGIFITGDNTVNRYPKWVRNNYVENHGPLAVGFGIYADYARNTSICFNTIKTSNGNDAIEMGNQGELYAIGNYIWDGQLQFPFASNSIIANNILLSNVIQNDANTADNMIITGNQVLGGTPAASFAGITCYGAHAVIKNNYVKVTTQAGIRVFNGDYSIIEGNYIDGTSAAASGSGVLSDHSSYVNIANNQIANFTRALNIVWDYNTITGNTVQACTTGVNLSDSSGSGHTITGTVVTDNNFVGATTPFVPNNQTNNYTVRNNLGLNPDRLYVVGNSGTATTITRVNGESQTVTITGNCTFTFTAGISKGDLLVLKLTQDSTGSRVATWPSNFKKAGGSLTLTTTASASDVITARWDGTNWIEASRALNVS